MTKKQALQAVFGEGDFTLLPLHKAQIVSMVINYGGSRSYQTQTSAGCKTTSVAGLNASAKVEISLNDLDDESVVEFLEDCRLAHYGSEGGSGITFKP